MHFSKKKNSSKRREKRRRRKQKQRKETSLAGVDRLSDLPDGVLSHILSFMEIRYAVRSSALSRRWRPMWTYMPQLWFILQSHDYPKLESIERTLALHAAPKILELTVWSYSEDDEEKVERLVRFAVERRVDALSLSSFEFQVGEPLYSHDSLKTLEITNFYFSPQGRVNWKLLKVLNVRDGVFMDIGFVLSGCPELESLKLDNVHFDDPKQSHIVLKKLKEMVIIDVYSGEDVDTELNVRVTAPNLKELEISGEWRGVRLQMIGVLPLVHTYLDFKFHSDFVSDQNEDEQMFQNIVKNTLMMVRGSEKLTIGRSIQKVLERMKMDSLPAILSSWKCLTLENVNLCDIDLWFPRMLSLLRRSPYLTRLVVVFSDLSDVAGLPAADDDFSFTVHFPDNNYFYGSQDWIGILWNIKTIEVYGIIGSGKWFSFVELLLKNAVVLEKMIIYPKDFRGEASSLLKVAQILLSLPRTSPPAVVILEKLKQEGSVGDG